MLIWGSLALALPRPLPPRVDRLETDEGVGDVEATEPRRGAVELSG